MSKGIEAIKKLIFDKSVIKFVAVGVMNTVLGTAIMFGFYNILHLNYWFSTASNYVLVSILSYFCNKYFTFKNETKGWKPILRFTVNIIVCYAAAYGMAKPLVHMILSGCSTVIMDNGAMLAGMGLFVILNYFGQRFFVFPNNDEQKGQDAHEKE